MNLGQICYLYNFADCPVGYYGYNCYKCSGSCQTCESTNGKCLSCVDPSKCGEYCTKPCQSNFSDTEFDVKAGICCSCVSESIFNRQIVMLIRFFNFIPILYSSAFDAQQTMLFEIYSCFNFSTVPLILTLFIIDVNNIFAIQ